MSADAPDWRTVTIIKVSSKFRVTIPKKVRDVLGLKPGERRQVLASENSIRFVRPKTIQHLIGIAKGMKWKASYRDRADRF